MTSQAENMMIIIGLQLYERLRGNGYCTHYRSIDGKRRLYTSTRQKLHLHLIIGRLLETIHGAMLVNRHIRNQKIIASRLTHMPAVSSSSSSRASTYIL